jgi:hypothetical protein
LEHRKRDHGPSKQYKSETLLDWQVINLDLQI